MMTKTSKALATALVGGSLLLTSACGGGGSRPSTSDIEKALTSASNGVGVPSGMNKSVYSCIAKAIHDSKLSNSALNAMIKGDKKFEPNTADKAVITSLSSSLMKCATDATK